MAIQTHHNVENHVLCYDPLESLGAESARCPQRPHWGAVVLPYPTPGSAAYDIRR